MQQELLLHFMSEVHKAYGKNQEESAIAQFEHETKQVVKDSNLKTKSKMKYRYHKGIVGHLECPPIRAWCPPI